MSSELFVDENESFGEPGSQPLVCPPSENPEGKMRPMTLEEFCSKHELFPHVTKDLHELQKNEVSVYFLCDDSSSMATKDCQYTLRNQKLWRTRWQELEETVVEAVELGLCLKCPKISIAFLNHPEEIPNVHSIDEIRSLFSRIEPNGWTPLSKRTEQMKQTFIPKKNTLLIIATDGRPTADDGKLSEKQCIQQFKRVLTENRDTKYVAIQILANTQDPETMKYLNKWDKQISRLDVTDDYESEKEQLGKLGRSMDRGTYVVKCFLGGWSPKWDREDEPKKCLIL